jgi:hypothetical protein
MLWPLSGRPLTDAQTLRLENEPSLAHVAAPGGSPIRAGPGPHAAIQVDEPISARLLRPDRAPQRTRDRRVVAFGFDMLRRQPHRLEAQALDGPLLPFVRRVETAPGIAGSAAG